eukprot:6445918-Prymnesium_polylepis.1
MLPQVLETNQRVKDMLKHTTGQRQVDLSQSAPAVLQRHSSAALAEYANLPLNGYRKQKAIHHINLDFPGLQLVNES